MKPNLSVTSKYSLGKRIASNTGLMMGAKFLAVFFGFGSMILASKNLTPFDLGIILFLHAYMLFFAQITSFKSWQSIIRYGTDDLKDNNVPALTRLLKFAIKIDLISAVTGFVLAIAMFSLVARYASNLPESITQKGSMGITDLHRYSVFYVALILFRQRGVSTGVFRLFDKFHVLAVHVLIMPFARFLGVLIAVMLGAGFKGFLLAWFFGSFIAYLFLPVMGLLELKKRRLIRLVFTVKSPLRTSREGLWPFMIKSNIDSALNSSTKHLPALLVMGMFGSTWVAVYRIAEDTAKLLSEGFRLLDQVIYPELAKMVSLGDASQIWRLVTRAALILLTFGLMIASIVHFAGPSIFARFFTADYIQAAPLASLLVFGAALMGVAAPLYPVLYAADHPERAIYARGIGVMIYITSFFILSATIGKMAPGFASIISNLVAVIILFFLAKHTVSHIQSPK